MLFVGILAASTLIARKRPQATAPRAVVPTPTTWTETGLRDLQSKGFSLVSIAPTESRNVAEYSIRNTSGVEQGSMVFWNQARATIAWHGQQYVKYAQTVGGVPTEYAGKVGATSARSIVIQDEKSQVVAEVDPLREGLEFSFTISSNGSAYAIAAPAPFVPLDRALHTVLKFGETVAAYQAHKIGDFSEYVALKDDLPDAACVAVLVCSLLR